MTSLTQQRHNQFFVALNNRIIARNGVLKPLSPLALQSGNNWRAWPIGWDAFHLSAACSANKYGWPHVVLEMNGSDAKKNFDALYRRRDQIQKEFGNNPLEWNRQPGKIRCLILWHPAEHQFNSDDVTQWPQQTEWLLNALEKFHAVFSKYISGLFYTASGRSDNIESKANKTLVHITVPKFNRSLDAKIINAAISGDCASINELLQFGADPNAVDEDGGSALSWAAYNGNLQAVDMLPKHGSLVNLEDKDNETPLSYAASKEYVDIVKLLLDHGADFFVVNSKGRDVLGWAISKGHHATVKMLMDHINASKIEDGRGHIDSERALDNRSSDETAVITGSTLTVRKKTPNDRVEEE